MAQIKVKATLPSGEVKSLSFPQRATVEQVKNKFFEFVPPRFRKEPYYIQVGNAVLDLEFYKILEAHHTVKDHLDAGSELDITFITQLDAKKLKQKGVIETVTPTAKSVTKDFVQAQKAKDEVIAHHKDAVAEDTKADADAKKKADEEAAAAKKAEEEAAAKKKAEETAAAAAKKKADEDAAAKKKADDEAAAAKKKADEEAAKNKFIDEPPITKALEESNKLAASNRASNTGASASADVPPSTNEIQTRIDENRKKFAADAEADEAAHKKKLAEVNAEWDAKLKELDEKDKAEEEECQRKVEELKKIGPTA